MSGTTSVTAPLPAVALADATAWLTRGNGRSVSRREIVMNAFAFYFSAMTKCPACQAGAVCNIHGTAALRPSDDKEPDEDISVADCRALTDVYFSEFSAARGEQPAFAGREGKAVKDLVRALGLERATAAVQAAFADEFWRGRATICTIAADPSRHLGEVSVGGRKGSLQADSGYQGGDERR